MDEPPTPRATSYLPHVAAATFTVAVCPTLVVWGLRSAGLVRSAAVSIVLGTLLALGASCLGSWFWKSRPGSGDVVFSDLMLWGWVRRWWIERRVASAVQLLEGFSATEELSRDRRSQLLLQLASALEAQDPHTHGHSQRVARHAAMIAKRMGLSRGEVATVRTAAALHDVGKLDTPKSILQKQGKLIDEEFSMIKLHPVRGAEMVAKLGEPELASIVRHHHERIDGTGYPDRLSGEQIPLASRIIAVADTFDAITSTRAYRPARTHKRALNILVHEAGTQLDVGAVRAFRSYYTGRRPLAVWAMITNLPDKLVSWLGGGVNVAAASVVRVMAGTALASAVAVGAVSGPRLKAHTPARQGGQLLASLPVVGTTTTPIQRVSTAGVPALSPVPATARGMRQARELGRRGAPAGPDRDMVTRAPLAATGAQQAQSATEPSSGGAAISPGPSAGSNQVQGSGSSPIQAATGAAPQSTAPSNSRAAGNGSASAGGISHGNGKHLGAGNGTGKHLGAGNGAAAGGSSGSPGNGNGNGNGQAVGAGKGTGNGNGNGNGSASGNANAQSNAGGQPQSTAGAPPASTTGQGKGNAQ